MRYPDGRDMVRPILKLSASGVSVLCLAVFAGPAIAGGCMSYSPESATINGADGCLNVGRHVRVEAQVMQGAASLGSGFTRTGDGPRPAAMRPESTTRLRMGPTGGLFPR